MVFVNDGGEVFRGGFWADEGYVLELGEAFVAVVVEMEVDDLELEVGAVVRLVWNCLNGRLYFLWCLSQKSLEVQMSNNGGCSFAKVIQADFLKDLFFFDVGCLEKVTGSKKKVVVVEMVVGVVERVV